MVKMTKAKAMETLAHIIVNDPADIRIGFSDEETARKAAAALSIIRKEKWLVSAFRQRRHVGKQIFFCYRVVKVPVLSDVFSGVSQYESEDEI